VIVEQGNEYFYNGFFVSTRSQVRTIQWQTASNWRTHFSAGFLRKNVCQQKQVWLACIAVAY